MCNWSSDGDCDDGGPGSEFQADHCPYGTDCTDCGPRSFVAPPPPPPGAGPEIVVQGYPANYWNECKWALNCTDGYSYPNGTMPQRVRPSPPIAPGSTCTLTLYAYWGYGWIPGSSWAYGDLIRITNPYVPNQSGERVETIYTFTILLISPPPPPPPPPSLPPVAPIANNTGFAMVVPQLIITYRFNGFSTACTASNSELTGCTEGTAAAPTPSVSGTTPWDLRNTNKVKAETNSLMGCSGRPRCNVVLDTYNGGIPQGGRRLQPSNANTLIIEATVTWTDAARVRTCPPVAPSPPPSPPSPPPPPPPPLPVARSNEISVEMIALGMGLYHERYFNAQRASSPPPPPPPPHR